MYELFLVSGATDEEAQGKLVELYSPPRVTERLRQLKYKGLSIGTTFDIRPNRNGDSFDLTKQTDRAKVRAIIRAERPYLVIGCPPCIEFTQVQRNWNHWRMAPDEVKRRLIQATLHLEFCFEIKI